MSQASCFVSSHAGAPDWRQALQRAVADVRARWPGTTAPTLGWVYFSDRYVADADALLDALRTALPGPAWVGCVGVGVCAQGIEYYDEPGLVVMVCDLPREQFRLFSGVAPLRMAGAAFTPHRALVHGDENMPDLPDMVRELSALTGTGNLFGGNASSRGAVVHVADRVLQGGLSGVAFAPGVTTVSRITHGVQPISPARRVTGANGSAALELDGRPALDVLLEDLGLPPDEPRAALPYLRRTLAGMSAPTESPLDHTGKYSSGTRMRHIVGLDAQSRAVALDDQVMAGTRIAFGRRDPQVARRDLVRACTEVRDEVESRAAPAASAGPGEAVPARPGRMLGAVYISCGGRGGPHFGGPSAELAVVRQSLGDVPLAGFFANSEIAGHDVVNYTAVLTVFVG